MLNAVRLWILFSSLLAAAGWILSALHELNRTGYAVVLALGAGALILWQRKTGWRPRKTPAQLLRKLRRRFRRAAPFMFLALGFMAFLGGSLYLSSNADSNGYRIPRILHWLTSEHWHWIRTLDIRMNCVSSDFEWISAPLILFTRTDRFIFLINVVSFFMLPGLIFSVFRRLQVSSRTAWWWMWLLPSGWCFIFQAGSDVNDACAAVYALAMVDLALRGREANRVTDLWLSLLAAALATGVKQTNIPLAFLWFIAAWPGVRLLLCRKVATMFVAGVGLLVSAVPETILNIVHAGNWQGLPAGTGTSVWSSGSPLWKLAGNLFCVPLQNLVPPFFPLAGVWNRSMQHFLQTPFGQHFIHFERFGYLSAGVSESQAGIGLGICLLMVASLAGAHRYSNDAAPRAAIGFNYLGWIRLMPWLLFPVFMAEMCSFENGRMLAAYYPLLFPILLARPGHAYLVRQLWWQRLGLLVMLLAAVMLVVSRNRPLFPEQTLMRTLESLYPHSKTLSGIDAAFAPSRQFAKAENYFKNAIPPGENVVGYATTIGPFEPVLWFPLGTRRAERVLPSDTPDELRRRGIHYVLVDNLALNAAKITIQKWMQQYNGSLVDQVAIQLDRHSPPSQLYLVFLRPSHPVPPN